MLVVAASVIESLAHAAQPWKDLYDDHTAVSVAVVFVHLAALLVGGGIALATDRATLRAVRGGPAERERHLTELGLTHRAVLGGLLVSFLSGIALFLADVDTFATSITYWVKMALVALLILNGVGMTRLEGALRGRADAEDGTALEQSGDATLWKRLQVSAGISAALWLATLLAGVALQSV